MYIHSGSKKKQHKHVSAASPRQRLPCSAVQVKASGWRMSSQWQRCSSDPPLPALPHTARLPPLVRNYCYQCHVSVASWFQLPLARSSKTPALAAAGALVHQREAEPWRNPSPAPAKVRTPQWLCRNRRTKQGADH